MDSTSDLERKYGPLIGGADLVKVLGFRTRDAFYKARARGRLGVRTFHIEGRRGLFSTTQDVAHWLAIVSPQTNNPGDPAMP